MITRVLLPIRSAFFGIISVTAMVPMFAVAADEATPLPDLSAIVVPEIATNDPKVLADGYKFFVFHNSSVDFATAYADIAECRSFLPSGPGRALPGFVPWVASPPPAPVEPEISRYGLVGDAIGAIILPKFQRGQDNTILRRCMETRGYVRFAVPEPAWERLNDPANPMIIAMQAKVATGPKPPQSEVLDQ